MIRNTPRIAAKAYRCDGNASECYGRVAPGERYLESVASPGHNDLGNTGWWRMRECFMCATSGPWRGL